MLLTHGHLDHVGRLPILTRKGYEGPIYATQPTIDIATLILRDSLSLQKQDLKRENKERLRREQPARTSLRREGRAQFEAFPTRASSSTASSSKWPREFRRGSLTPDM